MKLSSVEEMLKKIQKELDYNRRKSFEKPENKVQEKVSLAMSKPDIGPVVIKKEVEVAKVQPEQDHVVSSPRQ